MHRSRQQGVRKSTQFPIPQVGGGKKDALASSHGVSEMLEPLVKDPFVDVVFADGGKTRKSYQEPTQRPKYAIRDI